jgi:hypothetical protein
MTRFLVIDDDGPVRATWLALRERDVTAAIAELGTGAESSFDVMVADACMADEKLWQAAARETTARLIAISRDGVVSPVSDSPSFGALADRLSAKTTR